jgi:cytochrome c-type biogenesis protein CcmH/NrfG
MRQNRTEQAVRAYDRGMEESEVFDSARQALAASDFERATAQYGMLIKNKKRLDTVIEDLEQAVEGDQSDPRIWQILGDAYMKADRLDESIEAYRKGMDSV